MKKTAHKQFKTFLLPFYLHCAIRILHGSESSVDSSRLCIADFIRILYISGRDYPILHDNTPYRA
jgi:hypothetical protein